MGVDISGWVEIKPTIPGVPANELKWCGVIKLDWAMVSRNYDAFDALFGLGRYIKFPDAVPPRGLPKDISLEAAKSSNSFPTLAATWITWREIQNMDWESSGVDGRPHKYERLPDGLMVYRGKVNPAPGDPTDEGAEWERDGYLLRAETVTRRVAFRGAQDWHRVFKMMSPLTEIATDDKIRLVAWFYS